MFQYLFSVVGRYHVDADPDPTLHFDPDPDPTSSVPNVVKS